MKKKENKERGKNEQSSNLEVKNYRERNETGGANDKRNKKKEEKKERVKTNKQAGKNAKEGRKQRSE